MPRRSEIVKAVAVCAVVAILIGFTIYALPKAPPPSHVVSPDGTWSVLVFASLWETTGIGEGSFTMNVNVRDAQDRVVASFSVGIAKDREAAERDYVVSFENNEVANIGQVRRIKKSEFFR